MRRSLGTAALGLVAVAVASALAWVAVTEGHRAETPAPASEAPDAAPEQPLRAPRARARVDAPSAVGPEETPPEPARVDDATRWRVLRVVDAVGRPIQGVRAQWRTETESRGALTDAQGLASVPCPEVGVAVVEVFDGYETRRIELAEPLVTITVADLPLLEFVVVDGSTGRPIDVPSIRFLGRDDTEPRTWSADAPPRLALRADRTTELTVHVTPPTGYSALQAIRFDGPVALDAAAVRVVVPVFPEVEREFVLVDPDGAPAAGVGARASLVESADAKTGCASFGVGSAADSDASGRIVVRGLPRIAANAAEIRFTRHPDRDADVPGLAGMVRIDDLGAANAAPAPVRLERWNGGTTSRSSSLGWG